MRACERGWGQGHVCVCGGGATESEEFCVPVLVSLCVHKHWRVFAQHQVGGHMCVFGEQLRALLPLPGQQSIKPPNLGSLE